MLINCLKITQLPHNLAAQIVCPSPNVWDFDEKMLYWVSVVRGLHIQYRITTQLLIHDNMGRQVFKRRIQNQNDSKTKTKQNLATLQGF